MNSTLLPRSTGKVRGASLPAIYDLIRFCKGLENPHASWSESTPVCEWDGVQCTPEKEVKSIFWYRRSLRGALHWASLPASIRELHMYGNSFRGTLPLQDISMGLEILDAHANVLQGELSLSNLVSSFLVIRLSRNSFSFYNRCNSAS